MTTCKDPPALSSLVLLPSTNVTWMSDCASAGTSLAVGKRHLIQPHKGWELSLTSPCWMMRALPIIAKPALVLYCHLSAAHRPRPAGWQSCHCSQRFNAGTASLVGPVPLPCVVWNEVILRTGISCGCISKSPENLEVYLNKTWLNMHFLHLTLPLKFDPDNHLQIILT